MRSATPILDIQSTRRSREAAFSLARAKRDSAVDSQPCNRLLEACVLTRARPKPLHRLSCLSGLTSRARWVCPAEERSSARPRSVLPPTPFCCYQGDGWRVPRHLHPQEEPPALKHATGKRQPLLGDPGSLRRQLVKSAETRGNGLELRQGG